MSENADKMNVHTYIGLDLGCEQDHTALCVIEHIEHEIRTEIDGQPEPSIDYWYEKQLINLHRYPLGTKYPDIVDGVKRLLDHPDMSPDRTLILDATGVGIPVVHLFEKEGIEHIAIKIHGGERVKYVAGEIHIPKRDLVSSLMVFFQNQELQIAEADPSTALLVQELLNFKIKISKKGHDTYEAWRESIHDDLVLATALACWMIREGETAPKARWI